MKLKFIMGNIEARIVMDNKTAEVYFPSISVFMLDKSSAYKPITVYGTKRKGPRKESK